MANYQLTKNAAKDIENIISYISTDNSHAANQLKADFVSAFKFLSENPNSGRERPEFSLAKPYNFWVVRKNYVIVYTYDQIILTIHAVIHAARDIPNLI